MADHFKLTVLKTLSNHLKGITPSNGYVAANWGSDYDLSAAVFRGRATFGDGDPIPLVSILESPRSDTGLFAGEGGGQRKEILSVLIQGWATDDKLNPTDPAYGLLAVVEDRLERLYAVSGNTGSPVYPSEYLLNLPKIVTDFKVLPSVVRPPTEGVSSKAFFYLPVAISLVKGLG